jgi:C-terminal processing protease CtpA/Prc
MNYYPLLNRKAGKWSLLSFYNPEQEERWTRNTKLISTGAESQLLYRRWIEANRKKVHELSDGRIGYVHIRGMSDYFYRDLIKDVLGEEVNKEALVVDTRFNGGGDLTEDLSNFLNGTVFEDLYIRGELIGYYSPNRWTKPSIVVGNEGNYSDGHCFPVAYKDLELGNIIGMPIAGTCTAVWWERLQSDIVFGIPVMGVTNKAGEILENNELEPDIEVRNDYDKIAKGIDQQLDRAVSELMLELETKEE